MFNNQYITIEQAAKQLGMNYSTFYYHAKQPDSGIDFMPVSSVYLIDRAQLEGWEPVKRKRGRPPVEAK